MNIKILLAVIVGANVVGLWVFGYRQQQQLSQLDQTTQSLTRQFAELYQVETPTLPPTVLGSTLTSTDSAEISLTTDATIAATANDESDVTTSVTDIQKSLAALTSRVARVEQSNTPQPSHQPNIRELNFYLGSGSTNQTAWTTLPAVEVTIDSRNFIIHDVKFEAGLSVNGGEAYVRLINKNSGNVINGSQLSHNTQATTWKSNSIGLDYGNQTYQVQAKSSSGETITLHGARIKIYAE